MINAPHHIDITSAIITPGDQNHCHYELITKVNDHEIGTCTGCGRVLDYTILQDQVPILQRLTFTRKNVNLNHIMIGAKGRNKKLAADRNRKKRV
jgi:hypothetical protein